MFEKYVKEMAKFNKNINEAIKDNLSSWQEDHIVNERNDLTLETGEGFSSYFEGTLFRSLITFKNNSCDSSYLINKYQQKSIEKSKKYFENEYFYNLDDKKNFDNINDYLESIKDDDILMEKYYDSLDAYFEDETSTLISDISFYSKENIDNRTNKDIILVQVHFNADNQIYFISPTGQNVLLWVFEADKFESSENFVNKMGRIITKSLVKDKQIVNKLFKKM